MRVVQVTNCMDTLAGFEYLDSYEQKQVFLLVIDLLGGYPKPYRKAFKKRISKFSSVDKNLVAYLFVSNTCNACKLGYFEQITHCTAYTIAIENLTNALSLIL